MPPFSKELQAQQDYYRFEFLDDGYPGRDDGWAHPIYGVWVLNDYLDQHEAKPTDELEEAIRTVAHAAVERMDDHRGALVFWYDAAPERGARSTGGTTPVSPRATTPRACTEPGDESTIGAR